MYIKDLIQGPAHSSCWGLPLPSILVTVSDPRRIIHAEHGGTHLKRMAGSLLVTTPWSGSHHHPPFTGETMEGIERPRGITTVLN